MKPITRQDAIRIFCKATDQDDPYWDHLVDEFCETEDEPLPTIEQILAPLGITPEEIMEAEK